MKLAGSTNKRIYFFLNVLFRSVTFIGCLIAYIVVKITVKPGIDWLNLLLLFLALGSLLSGLFNLCMCGLTATSYAQNKWMQVLCLVFTVLTGGFVSSVFTVIAVLINPTQEEIKDENLFKVKKK